MISQVNRVALIVEASSAGVGRHVIDLAEELIVSGYSTHLLYSGRRMDDNFSAGIRRLRLAGAKTVVFDMRHNASPSDLTSIIKVRRYLCNHGPFQIVHAHSTKAGLIGRLAAYGLSCGTVYTPNAFLSMSPVAGRLSRVIASWIERGLSSISDALICVSDEESSHAEELGLDNCKVFQIANGINLAHARAFKSERASVRDRFGLGDSDVCIGFVGRLFPQKAPDLLLAAFELALPSIPPNVRLVIVGEGPLETRLKAMARDLRLGSRVVFGGAMPGVLAMAGFDVFALSSCYEGFPYVLIEALAMDLPIVSTAVGGASSLVRPGANGFISPVGSPREFAQSLVRVSSNPALRRSMADVSRSLAECFTVQRMARETVNLYRRLTETPAASRVAMASS